MLKKFCYDKILIIKTGQYETFTDDKGISISLGDVFRTTCLLSLKNIFPVHVSFHWFTSSEALPLFKNTLPSNTEIFNIEAIENILLNHSCLVINLERSADLQSNDLLHRINSSTRHKLIGFLFNNNDWKLIDYTKQQWSLTSWLNHCRILGYNSWGEMLSYLIGYDIPTKCGLTLIEHNNKTSDIGINWMCSNKWPGKSIKFSDWEILVQKISSKYKVSWQQGFNDLNEYINWIASNKIIVSLDSLGLHLATSMKIPIIGLFGNTMCSQIDLNGHANFLPYEVSCDVVLPIDKIIYYIDSFYNSSHHVSNQKKGISF